MVGTVVLIREKGETVSKGDLLCYIKEMVLSAEVNSDYDGTITRVLVEDGADVTNGTPLYEISTPVPPPPEGFLANMKSILGKVRSIFN
jgi:biotin carboxyl carrier protein